MIIQNDVSAKAYNSFGIDVRLSTLIELDKVSDLSYLSHYLKNKPVRILGGGSNVLLTEEVELPLCLVTFKGMDIVLDDPGYVLLRVQAGEVWHDVVTWAVEHGYGGIENLALIPGRTGAAPIQNIGAYGVEIKDVLHSVRAHEMVSGQVFTFHCSECGFGYRQSYFKNKWKDRFLIQDVTLKLTKSGHHRINTSYGAITKVLTEKGIDNPSISNVCDAVVSIRTHKLPDPSEIGNAGSFFKNPVISEDQYQKLKASHPEIVSYPVENGVKLAAGWLIDSCGWKGKIVGKTGTYENQALVLVNHGGASGAEVYALSESIQSDVMSTYGVKLEREVNVW